MDLLNYIMQEFGIVFACCLLREALPHLSCERFPGGLAFMVFAMIPGRMCTAVLALQGARLDLNCEMADRSGFCNRRKRFEKKC